MRKLYFLLALVLASCSSSDDSSSNQAFHPPTWIQGNWSFDENLVNGFKFTDNDYCTINLNQENCFPELLSVGYDVDEQINNTDYTITIISGIQGQGQQTNVYHFVKVDSENISFDDPIIGDRLMYKVD